jgi:hypothetical protein
MGPLVLVADGGMVCAVALPNASICSQQYVSASLLGSVAVMAKEKGVPFGMTSSACAEAITGDEFPLTLVAGQLFPFPENI